jgi:hypothetical protein
VPSTAAQSPHTHDTIEFAATVVNVVDGAPVPVTVPTTAGVVANLPLRYCSNTIECHLPVLPVNGSETVEAVPPVVHTPRHTVLYVWLAAAFTWVEVQVIAEPVFVGVPRVADESSVLPFNTKTSPVCGVNDGVVRVRLLFDAELTWNEVTRVGMGGPLI